MIFLPNRGLIGLGVDIQPKWDTHIYLLEINLEMGNSDGKNLWELAWAENQWAQKTQDVSYTLWKWRELIGKKTKKADVLERFLLLE